MMASVQHLANLYYLMTAVGGKQDQGVEVEPS